MIQHCPKQSAAWSRSVSVNTRPKRGSRARGDQANKMAGDQLDRLADQSASSSEQASRKRDLLKGPEEFRKMHVDPSKANGE